MASTFSEYVVTDDLTILLGLIAATLFLLQNFYRPQPLVHPILLGRQSDVARVRKPGESAIYRNYGTGVMGRFPVRPSKEVQIVADLIRPESDAPRTLWNTKVTNPVLQDRVAAFGTGLLKLAGLRALESNVLLLLNDSLEFLIADLALAAHSIPSFTVSDSILLNAVLDSHPPSAIIANAELLPSLLELIYDAGESGRHTIIVVGEPSSSAMARVASKIKVLRWDDVEREGIKTEKIVSPIPKPTDVFTVSFFATDSGHLQGVQLTHENITAGVAATRALLPVSSALSPQDTLTSAHSLSTAFGRVIAYTALYEGSSFATFASSKIFHEGDAAILDTADVLSTHKYPIPSPTIIFIKPPHLVSLMEKILQAARKSMVLFPFAWRHKIAGIAEGFLTKDSLWDRLVLDGARAKVIGEGAGTLRAVIVSGGVIKPALLTPARVAFSTALVNSYIHPVVAGPVLASHPLDVQDFSSTEKISMEERSAPVGSPSINIEAKLIGVLDDAVEAGGDPVGALLVRGPSVGKLLGVEDYVDVPSNSDEGWARTGTTATVQTNGAFRVV